jgi:hypothetical protein
VLVGVVPPTVPSAGAAAPPLGAAAGEVPAAPGVAAAEWPKIAPMIFPKTLIVGSQKDLEVV